MVTTSPLAIAIDPLTKESELYEKLPDNRVRCVACGHRCLIHDGLRGICKVRFNRDGDLYAPHGYVAALQSDPTEKKPFFHLLPGSHTLTFGMLGCDLHCQYCQNWITSQALRDPVAVSQPYGADPEQLIALAKRSQAQLVGSSYSEPLITAEWAVDVFRLARQEGLRCVFISNGNGTPEVLRYLRPWVDGYKVDLKSMSDKNYRLLGGKLQNILDTIQMLWEMKFWVEIVTLVIPGFNDSDEEMRKTARFLASVSREIPWHITAFHKDYKMTDPADTQAGTLIRGARIGQEEGLHYVYAGNLPGQVDRCCQSAKVGQIGTREDYCYEELRVSSLRVLL